MKIDAKLGRALISGGALMEGVCESESDMMASGDGPMQKLQQWCSGGV